MTCELHSEVGSTCPHWDGLPNSFISTAPIPQRAAQPSGCCPGLRGFLGLELSVLKARQCRENQELLTLRQHLLQGYVPLWGPSLHPFSKPVEWAF